MSWLAPATKSTTPPVVRAPFRWLLPGRSDYAGLRRSWSRDLAAGLTVGIVALPLALAFAVATGVGAATGLVTAIIAGAFAAVFGGSHVQVSGPTGAMTVVLVPLVAAHGPAVVYPVAVLAGAVLIVAAVLRLGRLLDYVPWPLVEGFTVGIAIVIAAQEVPSALGVAKPKVNNAAGAAVVAVGRFVEHPHWAVVGLLTLSVALAAGLPRLHRALPASLLAVIAVTGVAQLTGMQIARIGALPHGLPTPALPKLSDLGGLLEPALVVAFLAGLESLLSARVADGMSDAPRHDPNRELFGQGLANIASGICGGMPATGAIARTAVNARAGAVTRLAALTHALVLAAVIYAAAGAVAHIPVVALAGVLLVTAWRMVERHNVHAVLASTRPDALVFAVTAVTTVAFTLLTAVEAGLAVAGVLALRRLGAAGHTTPEATGGELTDRISDSVEHQLLAEHVLTYRLDGPLFFASAARFLAEFTAVTDVRVVILRLSMVGMLDATGARALGEVVRQLEDRHITVLIKGPSPDHARLLAAVGTLGPVLARGHVFTDLPAATAHALRHASRPAHGTDQQATKLAEPALTSTA